MQVLIIIVIALHVMAATFWAGSTFALARLGGAAAGPLFRPQMGAATVAIATGTLLWWFLHEGLFGAPEMVLGAGALAALAAVAIQATAIGPVHGQLGAGQGAEASAAPARVAIGHRAAAGLLAITALSMAVARFV